MGHGGRRHHHPPATPVRPVACRPRSDGQPLEVDEVLIGDVDRERRHEPCGQRGHEEQYTPDHPRLGVHQRSGTGDEKQPDADHDPDPQRLVALHVQRAGDARRDRRDQRGHAHDRRQPLRLRCPDHRERRGRRERRRSQHPVRAEPTQRQHTEKRGEAEQRHRQPALVGVEAADPRTDPAGQRGHGDSKGEPGDRERTGRRRSGLLGDVVARMAAYRPAGGEHIAAVDTQVDQGRPGRQHLPQPAVQGGRELEAGLGGVLTSHVVDRRLGRYDEVEGAGGAVHGQCDRVLGQAPAARHGHHRLH
jgi:hypothetical protein